MCGLVGTVGHLGNTEKSVFKLLLQLDTIRGHDSTGVLSISSTGCSKISKNLGTPWDLYDSINFSQAMTGNHKLLMGHNRWATKGGVSKASAHPFEFDNLVGAHNGTLKRQNLLDDSKDFKVDSENLYCHMDKNGLDDTLTKTDGSFALTWYDKTNGTINFIRNEERPLFYVFSDSGNLFWASEKWMLAVALSKCGVDYSSNIEEFEERVHYKADCKVNSTLNKSCKSGKEPAPAFSTTYINTYKRNSKLGKTLEVVLGDFIDGSHFALKVVNDFAAKANLYTNINGDLYQSLKDRSGERFLGVVSACYNIKGVTNFNIRPDSLTSKKDLYDWDGLMLTQIEWEAKSKGKSCYWCGGFLSKYASHAMSWSTSGDPLCDECTKFNQKIN